MQREIAKRLLFFLFGSSIVVLAGDTKPVSVETPHGTFQWKEQTYKDKDKAMSILVRELTPIELKKLDSDADRAELFIDKYVPSSKRDKDLLENLDIAFAVWLQSSSPTKETADDVVRIVGAAYGRYCISRLGVRWAIIRDEYGTDTALIRENPVTRSYPFSSIQYRIEDKKTDFIYALYVALKQVIEDAR